MCPHDKGNGALFFLKSTPAWTAGIINVGALQRATTPAAQLADAEGGNDSGRLFLSPNKTGEACASPVVKVSELRLWWTAYPPRPFPISPGSAFVLPFGCQSRVSHPPFFIDAFASISRDRRLPLEPPLWYDRFFWQNPVRVTRPVPPGRCRFLPPSNLSVGGFHPTG